MSTETRKPEKKSLTRQPSKLKKLGAVVVTAAALTGGAIVASKYESVQEREAKQAEAEALKSVETNQAPVINSVFVFNEGVNVRREPLRKSAQRAENHHSMDIVNTEFTVGKGERLVVSKPFIVHHDDGDAYIGFTMHDQEDPEEKPADRTFYVALSALQDEQSQTGARLYKEYSLGDSQLSYTYDSSTGELNANDSRPIASAQRMGIEEADFLISALPNDQAGA